MLITALAQLRHAASLLSGMRLAPWSLEAIIDGLAATRHEFGSLGADSEEAVGGPPLDEETRREFQIRRFRSQAMRGASETRYYRDHFANVDLARLRFDDITSIPLTRKEAIRADSTAFVRESASPVFHTTSTGTTGAPAGVYFSAHEMRTYILLTAIGLLSAGTAGPEDIVHLYTSGRGNLGNICTAGGLARVGALVATVGLAEPTDALRLLSTRQNVPGKKSRVSLIHTYPSYLGELVECGLRLGYHHADFGLEEINLGGELATEGLKARAQELFGEVRFSEGYGMTEVWPFGGMQCTEGHLHFHPTQGLLEVLHIDADRPTASGEAGRLVLTPFPPYRETTIVLRYDTEDLVRPIADPLNCSHRHLPATTRLLGKRRLSVYDGERWTFPRDVVEALEALPEVPLPARYGFWAVPGGIAVEVVVREDTAHTRRAIEQSLLDHGVRVQSLQIHTDRSTLQQPMPLRGDLREHAFRAPFPGLEAIEDQGRWNQLATFARDGDKQSWTPTRLAR